MRYTLRASQLNNREAKTDLVAAGVFALVLVHRLFGVGSVWGIDNGQVVVRAVLGGQGKDGVRQRGGRLGSQVTFFSLP